MQRLNDDDYALCCIMCKAGQLGDVGGTKEKIFPLGTGNDSMEIRIFCTSLPVKKFKD